jgi:hypothetical protein
MSLNVLPLYNLGRWIFIRKFSLNQQNDAKRQAIGCVYHVASPAISRAAIRLAVIVMIMIFIRRMDAERNANGRRGR